MHFMPDLTDITIAPQSLDQAIAESPVPIIVDFWAPWCGSCKMMAASVLRLADAHDQRVRVVGLNIEDGQDVALRYGVRSLPTMLVFRDGVEVSRLNGVKSYETLVREVAPVLGA